MILPYPFTQLGVNVNSAVWNGRLANRPIFFGDSNAEITSAVSISGGWNGDLARSTTSSAPWFAFGRQANFDSVGIFASHDTLGTTDMYISHRTILLGY